MLKSLYEEAGITAVPRLTAEIAATMEGNTRAKRTTCNHLELAGRKGTLEYETSSFKGITKAGRELKSGSIFTLETIIYRPPSFSPSAISCYIFLILCSRFRDHPSLPPLS
jgi:hypothetical protein